MAATIGAEGATAAGRPRVTAPTRKPGWGNRGSGGRRAVRPRTLCHLATDRNRRSGVNSNATFACAAPSMLRAPLCYRRHRFPPEIIQHAIWLYLRFTLSYRDVEERCCQVNFSRSEKPEAGCSITLPPPHSAIHSPLRLERSVALIARRDGVED